MSIKKNLILAININILYNIKKQINSYIYYNYNKKRYILKNSFKFKKIILKTNNSLNNHNLNKQT